MWSTLILKKAKASSLESGSTFLAHLFRAYLIYILQDQTQGQDRTGHDKVIHFPTPPNHSNQCAPISRIPHRFCLFFCYTARIDRWCTNGALKCRQLLAIRGCLFYYQQHLSAPDLTDRDMTISFRNDKRGNAEQRNKREYDVVI